MTAEDTIAHAMRVMGPIHRWTQGARARDALGREVRPHDRSAVQWCAIGAVEKVSSSRDERDRALDKLTEISERLYGCSLEDANDMMGRAAIIRIFRKVRR